MTRLQMEPLDMEAVDRLEIKIRAATLEEVKRLPFQERDLVTVCDPMTGEIIEEGLGVVEKLRVTDDYRTQRRFLALVKNVRSGRSMLFPYEFLSTAKQVAH